MSTNLPANPDPTPLLGGPDDLPLHAAGPYADDAASQAPQLDRYVAAVLRRKWIILLVTLLGTAAGVAGSRLVSLEYQAQSTLWVEAESRGGAGQGETGPIRSSQLLRSFAWIELLRSYTVLDHVVTQQHLFVEPDSPSDSAAFRDFRLRERFRPGDYELRLSSDGNSFVLSTGRGVAVEQVKVGEPVGSDVGFDWVPQREWLRRDQSLAFTVYNPREVAIDLSERLQTSMAENGNFLRLSLKGTNPIQITSTLNALADRYVAVAAQLKRAKLVELTEVLEEQRRYTEENLREAEIALENFRIQTITLPSDQTAPIAAGLEITRDPVFDSFFELRVQREDLRVDREALQRLSAQVPSGTVDWQALSSIPAAAASPGLLSLLEERRTKLGRLRDLQQRYTEEHPQVQRLKQDIVAMEQQTIPAVVDGLHAQLLDREAELERRIGAASGELREIPPRAIEEARLRRRVAIAENLHATLRQRYEEARLAAASSIPDIRILDEAVVPYQPLSDQRFLLILMGVVGSLGMGVVGAIVMDRIDSRVRYPEQITSELGLPILGLLPTVEPGSEQQSARLKASEAFREIRLGLQHAHGTAGPLMITISSPESGDGKSFVSSNLALMLAEQNQTTLLVDGDIRRGAMHSLFGSPRTPGLTDYLAGNATLEEVIRPTAHGSVSFIPAGTRLRNGPELLNSPAMAALLMSLRARYDAIIVDSPPLGAGVDAYVLGTMTRNLVLVVRIGQTDRAFTEAKLAPLARLPIRLLGAVLNGVPESRIYRHYQYLQGYEAGQDESTAVDSLPIAST